MYTEFYNLKEKPFNLSPSSKYLYLGEIHKEALALLTYGVMERMGFILLTGEVGTGKTTMVHALLNSLGDDVQCVYLSNPLFSVNDFMDYLAFSAFKRKVHFQSKADFLIQFESFLKERLQNQKNFILIIDEAQKLSIDLLEEIRLLSNMETADEKLINIFLIGQPELNETLNRMECRPLLQRISVRYHIKPLDQKGTSDYILARLKMAGAKNAAGIFPRNTVKEIFKFSGGYPRMINILADNLLLLGYSRGDKKLTPAMVKECYKDLQLSDSPLARHEGVEAGARPDTVSPDTDKPGTVRNVFLILLAVIAVLAGIYGKDIYSRLTDSGSVKNDAAAHGKIKTPSHASGAENQRSSGWKDIVDNIKKEEDPSKNKIPDLENNDFDSDDNSSPDTEESQSDNNSQIKIEAPDDFPYSDTEIPADSTVSVQEPREKTVTVRAGETLEALSIRIYGYANDSVFNLIKKNNPEIQDINLIEAGQLIRFPLLDNADVNQSYTVHIASFTPFESARTLFNDMLNKGYEAYIIPVYNENRKKIFRVTVGSFNSKNKANELAREIKAKDIAGYANVIRLETQ